MSQLGNQWRSVVKILDDDLDSYSVNENITAVVQYDMHFSLPTFFLTSSEGNQISADENIFVIAESKETYNLFSFLAETEIRDEKVHYDLRDINKKGDYTIHVFQIARGGLAGSYFTDLLLSDLEKSRVDSIVNFTWNENLIKSVRWDGLIQLHHPVENCCTFYISGKNVRLWINRYLIINEWGHFLDKEIEFSGFYSLKPGDFVELMVEVRDISVESPIKLMWSGNNLTRDVIPADALFWKVSFKLYNKFHYSMQPKFETD